MDIISLIAHITWATEPYLAEYVEEWQCEWNNEALSKRLAAYVQPDQGYMYSLGFDRSAQGILSSIPSMVIPNLDELTFASTWGNDQEAFRVRDFGSNDTIYSAQEYEQVEKRDHFNFLDRLKKPRSTNDSHGREIEVLEFTPSAVTTVLMSSAKPFSDGPGAFDVMLKHLSTEGFFDYRHKAFKSSDSCFCISIPFCVVDCGLGKIGPPTINLTRSIHVRKFSMSFNRFDRRVRSPFLI